MISFIQQLWNNIKPKPIGQKVLEAAAKEAGFHLFVENKKLFGWLEDIGLPIAAPVLKNINTQDEKGNTLLHYLGFKDSSGRLIEHGADANITNQAGEVPLKYLASTEANMNPFEFPEKLFLATSKENLNKVYNDGETIFIDFLKNPSNLYLPFLKDLMALGLDPNVKNSQQNMPFQVIFNKLLGDVPKTQWRHMQTWQEKEDASKNYYNRISRIITYFLKNDIGIPNRLKDWANEAFLPLLKKENAWVRHRGCNLFVLNIMEYLVDETNKNEAANFILHELACHKHRFDDYASNEDLKELSEKFINKTLKMATNIDEKNALGQTPLQAAIKNGNEDFALLLLNQGADIQIIDNNGQTLIHTAVQARADVVLKILLSKKAIDVNAVDANGKTALLLAKGDKKICHLLLENTADIATKDEFDFNKRTSSQVADRLISINGLEMARKTKKLQEAMLYMDHKDRMRVYVHIQTHLTAKEKEDITAIIRSKIKETPIIAIAKTNGKPPQHIKERD